MQAWSSPEGGTIINASIKLEIRGEELAIPTPKMLNVITMKGVFGLMKIRFMKWSILLLLFQINNSAACTEVQVKYDGITSVVCFSSNKKLYLSKSCKNIEDCFTVTNKIDRIFPNQSPGFTLCYSINGTPFFATVSNDTKKIPFCKLGNHLTDIESLALAQKH